MKIVSVFSLLIFMLVIPAKAQTAISDVELENFIRAIYEIRSINFQARAELSKIVQEDGYTLDEFEPLYQAKLKNDQVALNKISDKELKKINLIIMRFEAIEGYYDKKAEEAIEKNLPLERFDVIAEMLERDTTLQKRFQQILESLD